MFGDGQFSVASKQDGSFCRVRAEEEEEEAFSA